MATDIHPTAVVHRSADIGDDVRVGPHAVVGARVRISEGTTIGAGAQIEGPTVLGRSNRVYANACLGFDPQDLKYRGEETTLVVGDDNTFREFCTVHRGTGAGGGTTTIGSGNLFMTYTHVAHDSHVGDGTIFANAGTLAGHVVVEDGATVGAFSAVQQFCRVGRHAYIGGFSIITMDALPFMKTVGAKPVCLGVNRIGMERKGFSPESIRTVEAAMRILLRSGLNSPEALDKLRADFPETVEVQQIVEFVSSSEQGVIKALPGKRRSRGG
ncbi:MAG: acyl-ACP--UDP-N-acetylglucosamine O-acyltransferase [Acidobacteriota bacterium]|nr:acyl-ACP--UDP-N-acetylglucosamine O-acyltransferase [Acidobacteriota bacterium]